jgi:hypothetical protein
MRKYFPIWGSRYSYMTLQLLLLNFPINEENLIFFFISVTIANMKHESDIFVWVILGYKGG